MSAQLQQFVNRIEKLEDEKKAITADISEVYKEAKANGFDPKIMRKLIAKRKKPAAERQEEESLLGVYEVALGGVDNGPVTFTRKDGVKVTMERAGAKPDSRDAIKREAVRLRQEDMIALSREMAVAGLVSPESVAENVAIAQAINNKWGDGKPLEFDAVTGEIADHVSEVSNTHEQAAGEGATSPAATLSDVGEVTPQLVASEAVEVPPDETAYTADLSESLAIPDFMVRSKPSMHPAAQAEAFRA